MNSDPLPVSVIIPAYNARRFLAQTIDSALAQTRRPRELIVVDDGSTDDTADIVRAYGLAVCYEHQANAGVSAARNRGVQLAGSEYVAFLDADDLWAPNKLALQMTALTGDPALEAVFAHIEQFLDDAALHSNLRFARRVVAGTIASTMLVRRSAFLRIGWFNPERPTGGFMDWFAHAAEKALRYVVLPEVLAYRRVHGENMTVRHGAQVQAEYFRILKAALDRRRAGRPDDTWSSP